MLNRLPDEILFIIFQHLASGDQLECQYVCRSWYPPAHIQVLKEVILTSPRAIDQFIAAFDLDHNRRYSKSVKTISVTPYQHDNTALDQNQIAKLFFRFPSLEEICLGGLDKITNFDEDLCRMISSHCPKLRSFDVDVDNDDDRPILKKVRPLLTSIALWSRNNMDATQSVQFITQFPRLRSIVCKNESVDRLELFLPILEQLSDVIHLCMVLNEDMQEDPGAKYISTRPQKIQDQLIERLSNITSLSFNVFCNITNVIQFVSEYFTGLNSLYVDCGFVDDVSNEEENLYYRNLVSLINSVDNCYFNLDDMFLSTLENNFASFVQTIFQNAPVRFRRSRSRVLEISIRDLSYISSLVVNLDIESVQGGFYRNITIEIDRTELSVLVDLFKNGAPMDEVDVFKLVFDGETPPETPSITTRDYLQLFETMASLKEVKLEVPAWFDETVQLKNYPYSVPVLSLVEEATFNVSVERSMQPLLDSCCFAFPNLQLLNINGFSGIWNVSVGEFQLFLQDYSLEQLTLDVEPVIRKVNQFTSKTDAFFILELETRNLWKKRMYKVSKNLSYDEIMDTRELTNLGPRKDRLSVRLIVDSLKKLQLLMKGFIKRRSCIISLDDEE